MHTRRFQESTPRRAAPLLVAVAQLPGVAAGWEARVAWAEAALAEAGEAELLLLPEACFPGYVPGLPDADRDAARGEAWALDAARRTGRHLALGLAGAHASELLLVSPEGRHWRYRKRYPTFAETRFWRPGRWPGVAETALGRIGLVVCADVVQPEIWRGLQGRVDLVLVAAAWGDFAGRTSRLPPWERALLGPWMARAAGHRDQTLARGARALGVPLAYANACGPWKFDERFDGDSRILGPDGAVLVKVEGSNPELGGDGAGLVAARVQAAPGGDQRLPEFPLPWRAFSWVHRNAARARAWSQAPAAPAARAVHRSQAMSGRQAAAKAGPSSSAR